ncbi:SDR family oxidoreductase [Nocardioides daeguensis]|uniref:SDR family oxidoreductase n=1 Tax=Nocardioides daeguensis TaxID=908359 RepID=A0ABP6W0X1_9ACTN|nr:SDR family oxidoreductase [Nocardioides daeguensis]MBV6726591.1 SDR family oxidoreductase [Nocardioides daeguensis]MCR1774657.1 SDR family oxidoreductase [Nocardioides daeguensis]
MADLMPDLTGQTFLVTGANTGIGKETVRGLAGRGARVVVAGRSAEKTRAAIREITADTGNADLDFLPLDLGDLASVRTAAETFLASGERLDVLVNNAGLAGKRGMSASGFELAFGTNHVGPFLFTELLRDRIVETGPGRIVNVASTGHYRAPGIDWKAVRRPSATRTAFDEYCVSKLANVLHARELGRRLEGTGVTTYSLHPGAIASDVWREVPFGLRQAMKLFLKSPQQGARTSLYCATSPDVGGVTGRYYDSEREKRPSKVVTDALAAELWARSEEWVAAGQRG